jgi:hypothetical protein
MKGAEKTKACMSIKSWQRCTLRRNTSLVFSISFSGAMGKPLLASRAAYVDVTSAEGPQQ